MKKRYLRFQALTAPKAVVYSHSVERIIDVSKLSLIEKNATAISLLIDSRHEICYFQTEEQAEQVYNKIWEMLIQQED